MEKKGVDDSKYDLMRGSTKLNDEDNLGKVGIKTGEHLKADLKDIIVKVDIDDKIVEVSVDPNENVYKIKTLI
jgi:hypothetical protein